MQESNEVIGEIGKNKIDSNKCPRCTFNSYNEIIEKVIIDDQMYRDLP